MNNTDQQKRILLNTEVAAKLGGALQRLHEIRNTRIITVELDAEKSGLEQYLQQTLSLHANELLGCWWAMHNEYEPLIMGFVSLLQRANSVIGARHAAMSQREQSPAIGEPADNVISLDRK